MFDVDSFVAECRSALSETQPALAIKALVERAVARPGEIDAALGAAAKGGLRCLHQSGEMTVLQFVWPPGVVLFPHEHRMWAANGIYGGGEENVFYRRGRQGLEVSGGKHLAAGDVALLGVDAIHAVSNPHGGYTAAIHVYGGDYFAVPRRQWNPDEQPFDVAAVARVLAEADARVRAAPA